MTLAVSDYRVGVIIAALQRLTLRGDQADRLIHVILDRIEPLKPLEPQPLGAPVAAQQEDAQPVINPAPPLPAQNFTPEVLTGNIDNWIGAPEIVFATHEETEGYVRELAQRWHEVKLWRVIETPQPVTYRWNRWTGLQAVLPERV